MLLPVDKIWPADGDVSLDGEGQSGQTGAGQGDLGTRDQVGDDEDQNVVPENQNAKISHVLHLLDYNLMIHCVIALLFVRSCY